MLASIEKLKDWAMEIILNYAEKAFTIENFKTLMGKIADNWEAKAKETDTFIDDWAVDFLRSVVDADEKVQKLYDWIKPYIFPAKDGVVKALPFNDAVAKLACDLTETKEQTAKAINISAIVEVLQVLIPLLIDLFSQFKKE